MKKILLFSLLIAASCSRQQSITSEQPEETTEITIFEEKEIFMACIQYPDIFQSTSLDKIPTPKQGMEAWIRDFYTALKYPADSREKGIQGTVKLTVRFATDGSIESMAYNQQVAPDIDNAAVEAFKVASSKGFSPGIHNGIPVRVSATVPMHFRLG